MGEREREGGVREDCPLPGPRGARQGLQPPPQVALPYILLNSSHRRSKELMLCVMRLKQFLFSFTSLEKTLSIMRLKYAD